MRAITLLPYDWQIALGGWIGKLGLLFAKKRRHTVEVNIDLCFSWLNHQQRIQLIEDTFRSTGIGVIETAYAWFNDPHQLLHRTTIEGVEHLRHVLSEGKGVILMGMHLSTLDLCGALLSTHVPFDIMYRRNRNDLSEAIMTNGRAKNFPSALERDDIRGVLRSLKAGRAVWYGPDHDYGLRHSVFAPFFGVEAASITATARLARISGSPVIAFSHYRDKHNRYTLRLSPPLTGFPTGDDRADATKINRQIEKAIQKAPEQYWWSHRRFKTQPAGREQPY
jgi:KDO2-lipid IV(A) lauroyltransferase